MPGSCSDICELLSKLWRFDMDSEGPIYEGYHRGSNENLPYQVHDATMTPATAQKVVRVLVETKF